MTHREQIDNLTGLLRKRLPGSSTEVDAPARASGRWFVNVNADGQSLVVEYRPKLGFGLSSTPSDGYGEGADEFFPEAEGVVARIVELVGARKRTEPQRVRLLQQLRERRDISQVALATKLGVRQPTVSKIERREDVALSTVRRYVEALGGRLHVTAEFADGKVEISFDDQDRPGASSRRAARG
jgi:DNA-binding XRE family transcriptional regulator